MKSKFWGLLAAGLLAGPMVAQAGLISYPPPASANSQRVASNMPNVGQVWSGVGQSFTAEDSNVLFGFYAGNFTQGNISESLILTLYSGNGLFSNPLGQASATVSLASFASGFVQVDFSSIPLTPGQFYTVLATTPSGLPALGSMSNISLLYNTVSANPLAYAGGRFWFSGASYNQSLSAFADRDLAFMVTPVIPTASVPEPGSLALLGLALAGLGSSRRRKAA